MIKFITLLLFIFFVSLFFLGLDNLFAKNETKKGVIVYKGYTPSNDVSSVSVSYNNSGEMQVVPVYSYSKPYYYFIVQTNNNFDIVQIYSDIFYKYNIKDSVIYKTAIGLFTNIKYKNFITN